MPGRGPRGKLVLKKTGMTTTTESGKQRPLNFSEQIQKKADDLWGEGTVVEVESEKSTDGKALGRSAPNGWTAVRVKVNGKETEVSLHFNKSQAFRGVLREMEKLYERSLRE